MKKKHISSLVIGDEIIVIIPAVTQYIGLVSFINEKENFIFIDGDIDDEDGFAIIPDDEGYYKIP